MELEKIKKEIRDLQVDTDFFDRRVKSERELILLGLDFEKENLKLKMNTIVDTKDKVPSFSDVNISTTSPVGK